MSKYFVVHNRHITGSRQFADKGDVSLIGHTIASDPHTQKRGGRALAFKVVEVLSVARNNELIINMYHENDRVLPLLSNIQAGVSLRSDKANRPEPRVGACLSPYKDFLSLSTFVVSPW